MSTARPETLAGGEGARVSDAARARTPAAVARFHDELVAREAATWGDKQTEQLGTYVWRRWYRPGFLSVARMLASAAAAADADALVREVRGTSRTAERIAAAAEAAGLLRVSVDGRYVWHLPPRHEYVAVDLEALPARSDLGQLPCTPGSRRRVAELVLADLPWGGEALLLGDDDLIAPSLAASGITTTVLDVDDRLDAAMRGIPAAVRFVRGDVRAVPAELVHRFDAVVLDPADNSPALAAWLWAASAALVDDPGARVYLAVSPARLGHRWAALVADASRMGLVPCGHVRACKEYVTKGRVRAVTDCWIFERVPPLSHLPHPYLGIETFR